MFVSQLDIDSFRLFKGHKFIIGKFITVIAGFNTTGKSTILALLGNCGEFLEYKPLLHSHFRSDLSDIIKFSKENDPPITHIGTLFFEDLPLTNSTMYPSELSLRSTRQGGSRYRIIPKIKSTRKTEAKIKWPTLYLGLGRLFPVGESSEIKEIKVVDKLSDEAREFIKSNIVKILNSKEPPVSFSTATIAETNKKKAVGINTATYDYKCNSAGQDNLGQILMSILSFRQLKVHLGDQWNGGLLLIDELDTTLHPLAQNKLIDFLFHQAKEVGFQIVFTTHSLSLLDYVCNKTNNNMIGSSNDIELIYIRNSNGPIEVHQNPPFSAVYNDLMPIPKLGTIQQISIFSEDAEARYFIEKLLGKSKYHYNLLETSMGNDTLLNMFTSDSKLYNNFICVLDGDVEKQTIDKYKKGYISKIKSIIKLPGNIRPEQLLWEYAINLPPNHPLFAWSNDTYSSFSKTTLEESGPPSRIYTKYEKERERYKNWFKDNPLLIDSISEYWLKENVHDVTKFVDDFSQAYNWVARNCFIPEIVI